MKILIADDDRNLRMVLTTELSEEGFEVDHADSGLKVMDLLEKDGYDILVLDLNMPGLGGMEVLQRIQSLEIPVEVIILTGHATVSTAVEAMKLGAYDYLTKPFKLEVLIVVMEKAYEKKRLLQENLLLKTQIKRQATTQRIITKSPAMFEILGNVKKIAQSDFPVLISGESGVGKELIAMAVHEASPRVNEPFIPINCGAIPENMIESELFGHERGAFTGAHAKKLGLLEIANHGTLFLDEIGELTLPLQGKLLRVIETKTFFRVGGIKEVKVDVRFVSATNRDVKSEVEKGQFRSDLYYRISALNLYIPPLRERKECIPLLVENIIKNNLAFKNKRFSDEAVRLLSEYSWPGNVRELQNVVHRTLLLSKSDTIEPDDLPEDLAGQRETASSRLEDIEREHILKVLKDVGGQRGKAAEVLGVDPKTLFRKLSSYGVK
ncbi:MAG: sigma-54-dependent Fis family transcriptional regulator [Candidatus Tectomicrobia bacterium]|uniref:Sigma-54-dependent Fis family transcriptional regulator n=1 Tax=Tectimicrobiota bacterium TaxID=2528274 RepID=A0A933GNF8_UNCTE|nr:sigma-54-dependent Fis family transcriptional regulator [Candidatus Tectomicrobia bacterium]